ncbi:MAG: hypothetical protein ACKVQU_25480 [Burkholderiales bacterium]
MLQTMLCGSLPRPTRLTTSGEMGVQWKLEGDALAEGQDDAARVVGPLR